MIFKWTLTSELRNLNWAELILSLLFSSELNYWKYLTADRIRSRPWAFVWAWWLCLPQEDKRLMWVDLGNIWRQLKLDLVSALTEMTPSTMNPTRLLMTSSLKQTEQVVLVTSFSWRSGFKADAKKIKITFSVMRIKPPSAHCWIQEMLHLQIFKHTHTHHV